MNNFFAELKRRNVFRVGIAYAIVAWVVLQFVDVVSDTMNFPDWIAQAVLMVLIAGLPVALLLSWAFEVTPEGVMKTADVDKSKSVTHGTGQKINKLIAVGFVLALGFIAYDKMIAPSEPVPQEAVAEAKSVAVLPFADLSEGSDQEWFADGLTEEILNSLARLPELQVTARTSSFQFKGVDRDIGEIAKTLGVATVVEGSVRRIGDRLRITAQLIRASDGFHLWSNTYDSTADDLFDVQGDVAEKIAGALDVVLDDNKRQAMVRGGTRNVEAYRAFKEGGRITDAVHNYQSDQTLWDANVFFERAMELDPGYADPAIIHMDAFAHYLMDGPSPYVGQTPPYSKAEAQALMLQDLDFAVANFSSPTMQVIADINREYFSPTWYRMPGLIARLDEVLDLNDMNLANTIWLHNILIFNEEFDLLFKIIKEWTKDDPLDPIAWSSLADIENLRGDFKAAQDYVTRGRQIAGDHSWMRWADFSSAAYQGKRDEAIILLEKMVDDEVWYPAYLAAIKGDYETAAHLAGELTEKFDHPQVGLINVYFEIGDQRKLKALTKRVDQLPVGAAMFGIFISTSDNALYFDLADTPNF
ncbi:MAG: hypothetical protein ACTSU8_01480, partial [Alphaproteobacteria bacterium]